MNSKSSDKLKCVCETATWCRVCNSVHFKKQFDEWTSGNETIDNFIQKIQLEAINDAKILEWVPFKYISSVEPLAKGGYGIVYKAKWELGPISHYDNEIKSWCRSGKTDVVLKYIKNLNNFYEFFQEITAQMTSTKEFGYIIRCYGITKCPGADKYLMIMDYKKDGNLEKYLYSNFKRLNWERKLELLYTTIKGLYDIHEVGLEHKDFHCGNIVIDNNVSYITDFGLCNNISYGNKDGVFGVLPFVAPEVLCRNPYTKAADIYSFGMIMYQIASGYPPYFNIPHDDKLAFDIICNNLRPKVDKNTTPQIIIKLIESCLSENFEERPTAIDLLDKISSCMQKDSEIWYQIKTIEENKNFNIAQSEACLDYKILKEASYTSKDINFISESDVASYMSRHISFQLETVFL